MSFFTQQYLDFFKDLSRNNTKDWFDLNRKRYEIHVKKPFESFVQHLIDTVANEHPKFKELRANACIFRINRDIRFSQDKTPYKTMCAAVLAVNGKKSSSIHGIYFEFTPEHIRVYGGVHDIEKGPLLELREGIAQNLDTFKKHYTHPVFTSFFGEIQGDKNKIIAPHLKSFAEKEPLLFNKQFYFYATFPAEMLLSDHLVSTLVNAFEIGKPIEDFFNQFIHRT